MRRSCILWGGTVLVLLVETAWSADTLTAGRAAKFLNSADDNRDSAVVKFVNDTALSAVVDPASPQNVSLRFSASGGYDVSVEVPCGTDVKACRARGAGFSYSDRLASVGGIRKIGYAPGRLLVRMKGAAYAALAGPLPGSTPYVEVRFTVGGRSVCGRFQQGLRDNDSSRVTFRGPTTECGPICGDGLINGSDACDDGGVADGDGCSSGCAVEPDWQCSGEPSVCTAVELPATFAGFRSPTRIALDPEGVLYVSDTRRGQVSLVDLTGERVGALNQIAAPVGIAVFQPVPDSSGAAEPIRVYVGDEADGSVRVFVNGQISGHLGQGAGEFGKPNAIWITSDGTVHVVDSPAHVVKVYDTDGAYLREYGDLWFPTDLVIDEGSGEIFVTDFMSEVVAVFDMEGQLVRVIAPPLNDRGDPAFTRPIGLGSGPYGRLYVVDNALSSVAALDREGNLLEVFGYEDGSYWTGDLVIPVDAVSDGTRLYVSSNGSDTIEIFDVNHQTAPLSLAREGTLDPMAPRSVLFPDHMGCENCHSMRLASYPSLLGYLCQGCHVDGGRAPAVETHSSRTTDDGYGNWEVDCWGCHDPHQQMQDETYGTTYGKLLRVDLSAPIKEIDPADPGPYWWPESIIRTVDATIRFTSNQEFVNPGNPPENDICQACHEQTLNYACENAPDIHTDYGIECQPGGTCTACHAHQGGFKVAGGCLGCHALPRGSRRQIVDEGGDFARASHHVNGEIEQDDCTVCHNIDRHTQGTVVLEEPDAAGVTRDYDPGDPAGLEDWCLACHDADGATAYGGTTPFSDGRTVPDVKGVTGSLWQDSAHNLRGYSGNSDNQVSCFGDGSTNGCHGNAHGSDNVKLLSAGAGVTVDQFCFECHTEGKVENVSISIWDPPYSFFEPWPSNRKVVCGHTETDGQAILTDGHLYGEFLWTPGEHVGRTIKNITDGSSGEITANTENTITATLSGGAENDWDLYDTYAFKNVVADDIDEAFGLGAGQKHDLGTSFTVGANSYTLQCTSCHNPHVATGRHSEAASGVSSVSRPDFSDSVNNPRAMGATLWGAITGEKMDAYAGAGTYRTPKGDPFSGGELPDYNTLCSDCHETMAGEHGNLGFSGDAHGAKAADAPVEGGFCPDHENCGKGVKWDADNCTADDGGSSDGACWPVLPQGRSEMAWSKTTYDQQDRLDGMNFILSCIDCHEAHASPIRSMLRRSPNHGTGGTSWYDMCGNCHSYRLDTHRGKSCGNSSCHNQGGRMSATGTDTIHQMASGGSPGNARWFDSDLVVNMSFENNLEDSGSYKLHGGWSRKRNEADHHLVTATKFGWLCENDADGAGSFTAGDEGRYGTAIAVDDQPLEVGTEDCEWSTWPTYFTDMDDYGTPNHIHYGHGTWKYSEMKYNMTAEAWVYPTVDDGERKIIAKHTYWSGGYALVLEKIDAFGDDTPPGWSEGMLRAEFMTNVNGGSSSGDCNGLRGAYSTAIIPLNRWTHVAATYDASGPDRDPTPGARFDSSIGRVRIYVNGEDVTRSHSNVGMCFAQPGPGESAMFPNSDHNILDPDTFYGSALSIGGLNWSDPASNFVGRIDEVKLWNVTKPAAYFDALVGPTITKVEGISGYTKLYLEFAEGVYGTGPGGKLQASDLGLADCGGKWIVDVIHSAGDATAIIVLNAALDAGDTGTCTVAAVSVDDENGASAFADPVTVVAMPSPAVVSVEGVVGSNKLKVAFSSQIWGATGETGPIGSGDLTFTDGGGGATGITGVSHAAGSPVVIVTVDTALPLGDVGSDAVSATGGSIFGIDDYPVGVGDVFVTAQTAPTLTRVEGVAGHDQVFVSFSEGVYTGTGQSGALVATDFVDSDAGWDVGGVAHVAGQTGAILTLTSVLAPDDPISETIAAAGSAIFNSIDNPADTTPVNITDNNCPAWGTTFPIEHEPLESATVYDATGLLSGAVANPGFSFPNGDNNWFTGAEEEVTNINIANNACLSSPRALTVEARVKPTEVDRGIADNTFNRIFERRRNILVTILNTDYRRDDVPERADRASIEVKYRVETASRHDCPHPQWPYDSFVGNDTRMHQISSDIDQWPLVNGHWYVIRVVFNSDKYLVPGSDGTPVDVFIDDQGADGADLPNPDPDNPGDNPDYEQWPDYENATKKINESSSCRWGSLPGDIIEFRNDSSHIGSNWNNAAQWFEGQIDWLTWKPVADYVGVDDPPH